MKIIKKEIVTTVEKYIAEDGTEFTSEKACLDYEEDCLIESAKNKIFKNCEICKALKDCCPCDGGEYMEDHNFTWVRPNSEEDIDALEKAFGPHFKTEDIGKWLCIEGTPYDSNILGLSVSKKASSISTTFFPHSDTLSILSLLKKK